MQQKYRRRKPHISDHLLGEVATGRRHKAWQKQVQPALRCGALLFLVVFRSDLPRYSRRVACTVIRFGPVFSTSSPRDSQLLAATKKLSFSKQQAGKRG